MALRNCSWSTGIVLLASVILYSSQAFCIATSAQYEENGHHHFLDRMVILYCEMFWSILSTPPMFLLYSAITRGWVMVIFYLSIWPGCDWLQGSMPKQLDATVVVIPLDDQNATSSVMTIIKHATWCLLQLFWWCDWTFFSSVHSHSAGSSNGMLLRVSRRCILVKKLLKNSWYLAFGKSNLVSQLILPNPSLHQWHLPLDKAQTECSIQWCCWGSILCIQT